nr:MAG TPA: Large Terminase [Caudoviricetes sp.]
MKYLNELLEHDEQLGVRHSKSILRAFEKHRRIHQRALDGVYKYKPEVVEQAIKFVENEFYKTTGVLELIQLQPAQKWWFELWFGYYTENDDILINETFLNIIRGAGKSTIMAAVEMFWMMFGGSFGGESLVIAFDNNQAEHVFGQVRNQITSGSGLLSKLGESGLLKTTKSGIRFLPNKNEFKKQTNDTDRAQGGNTSLNIFDEVHVYKSDIVTAVNKGSRAKQDSWRSIYITSGGLTRGHLYDKMIERFKSDAEFESDRSIGLIYQLDSELEVTDEKNWSKAAPMIYEGLPKIETVREEYQLAKGDPALQIQFLAYNMGVAMNSIDKYILESEAAMTDYDFDDVWFGADIVAGIDMSIVGDLTAITFVTEKNGIMYTHTEALGSRNTLGKLSEQVAKQLEHMPNLTITEGAYITADDVFDVFRNFVETHNCNPLFIGYDKYQYHMLKDLIDDYFFDVDGDRQQSIRQGFALSDVIKLMKDKLADKSLIHNSPLLRWSLLNFAVKVGSSGDLMPMKLNENEKIDPVVALIMALQTVIIKGI